jgi:oligopeptide transport system permease protein
LRLYILKRFMYSALSLFIIVTITFFIMHWIPGEPYTGEKALPPKIEANIKAKYGLDKPLLEQYIITLKNLSRLDFGMSMKNTGREVNDIIKEHFPVSARLGVFSLVICLALGVPLGVVSALKRGKWQDILSMLIVTMGVTVPSFVIAALMQYYFSVRLKWFPVMGFDTFKHYVLPGMALSLFTMSFVARLIRSGMIEVMEQDFVKAARAKGLSKCVVIYKHALRNAAAPAVSFLGPLIASMLTGTFVVEKVFSIPGLGRYFISSISNRDYTTIMGLTFFYAAFLIAVVFIVDILHVIIDPRIKLHS